MGFAKLFDAITESSLWGESKATRLLFVTMLAKADATGFVEASLPGIARAANLDQAETEEAMVILESPDEHSKDLEANPQNEGRRVLKVPRGWMIINYEEYRNRRSDEDRREYMRKYMKDYRAKSKQRVNTVNRSKPPLAQAEAEAEAEHIHTLEISELTAFANSEFPTIADRKSLALEFHSIYSTQDWRTNGANPINLLERGKWKHKFKSFVMQQERGGTNGKTPKEKDTSPKNYL